MPRPLDDWAYFVAAVEAGGFTAAGRQLHCPKTTVSKRVAALEARLGTRLLHRSSRRFTLTDMGQEVFEHARAALIEVEAAEQAVLRRKGEPAGVVRITASVPVAQGLLARELPALARRYPRLQVQLHVSDRFVDLVRDGFDIAVRSHTAPLPDSDLVAHHASRQPVMLVAGPDYLQANGIPVLPDHLTTHAAILTDPARPAWSLARADGSGATVVTPCPVLFADEGSVMRAAAEAGLGITALPESLLGDALATGILIRVMPGWTAGTITTTVLTTHRRGQLPAVRAVVAALCAADQSPTSTQSQ